MSSNADALDRTDADRLERVGTDKPKYRTISDGFDTDRACLLIRGLPAGMVCGWESGWPQPAPGCGRLTAGHVRDGNSRSPGYVSGTRQIRLVRTSQAASAGQKWLSRGWPPHAKQQYEHQRRLADAPVLPPGQARGRPRPVHTPGPR